MSRKLILLMTVAVAIVALFAMAGTALAEPATIGAPASAFDDVRDVGPDLRTWDATADRIADMPAGMRDSLMRQMVGAGGGAEVGDIKTWLALDDVLGSYYFKDYELRAVGAQAEIWVALDLQNPDGHPENPVVITDDQIAWVLDQFDSTIYPKMSKFFGVPVYRDGSYPLLEDWGYVPAGYYDGDKLVILVDNVADARYYDPSYPFYIAGFFSPSYAIYFDRNVMTIDAYDWANRLGPDTAPWREGDSSRWRPWLYEGTFAHEYQHLLHNDVDGDEENFINEGMADMSEWICGYGQPQSHIDFFAEHPENSLVLWGDQSDLEILADYGNSYLFQLYLYEQAGGAKFTKKLFNDPANGITSINMTLRSMGVGRSFSVMYHDFTIATVLDSKSPGGGKYYFKNVDFKVNTDTEEAFSTPGAPPWGTDYWVIDPSDVKAHNPIYFDGADYSSFPTKWSSDGEVLWGGDGNLVDNWAIFEAQGGGTLTFDTYMDAEYLWDYGFVQVSTDGGHTWTSLENGYTVYDHDPNAHPTVLANLPGLTGTFPYWVTMSFDLGAYAGQDILVAFRYVTDWSTYYTGWFIDNVYVDGELISDGSTTAPFKDLTEILPTDNDFTVSLITETQTRRSTTTKVTTMDIDHMTEQGAMYLWRAMKSSSKATMLVTFDAPEGFPWYADYWFWVPWWSDHGPVTF